MPSEITTEIAYSDVDFPVHDIENENWAKAGKIFVDRYWSGEKAPAGRCFSSRLLWSDTALYIYFEADQTEHLVMSEKPNKYSKTDGLWERDVCEIFIAPDPQVLQRYFEFEIAPNGEWLDLAIDLTGGERLSDTSYHSGMRSFAKIEASKVKIAAAIDWEAFGSCPNAGDVWLGNLFRCVGTNPGRGYLAWAPTYTETPNFHVPEKFGQFKFVR